MSVNFHLFSAWKSHGFSVQCGCRILRICSTASFRVCVSDKTQIFMSRRCLQTYTVENMCFLFEILVLLPGRKLWQKNVYVYGCGNRLKYSWGCVRNIVLMMHNLIELREVSVLWFICALIHILLTVLCLCATLRHLIFNNLNNKLKFMSMCHVYRCRWSVMLAAKDINPL